MLYIVLVQQHIVISFLAFLFILICRAWLDWILLFTWNDGLLDLIWRETADISPHIWRIRCRMFGKEQIHLGYIYNENITKHRTTYTSYNLKYLIFPINIQWILTKQIFVNILRESHSRLFVADPSKNISKFSCNKLLVKILHCVDDSNEMEQFPSGKVQYQKLFCEYMRIIWKLNEFLLHLTY